MTVIKIKGREEIGEGDEGFTREGEIIVTEVDMGFRLDIEVAINGRHAGQHDGVFAHPDPRELVVGQKIRIKGHGKANNAWVGNVRKNFGEWIVVSINP